MNVIDKIKDYLDRPKLIDFYNVFSQLYMLLSSGCNLQQAIGDIVGYQEKRALKDSLKSISKSLSIGLSTGAAFRKESLFPIIVAPSLEAGDKAGALPKSILQLSEMFFLQHNLYSKINNALFTPKISAVILTLLCIGYVKIAVPEFIKIYHETGMELPVIISIVSSIVNGIVDYWYLTILSIYMLWKAWEWFVQNNRGLIDSFRLKLPIYKQLHYLFIQHQFASTLSLMLSSGLTVPDALLQAQKVVDNVNMADSISRIRNEVLKGLSLTDAITKNNNDKVFDRMLIASINAGERAANLPKSLNANCKYYERTLNNLIDPVSTKITLVVIIPIGLFMFSIYAFSLIPLFSYVGQV